MHLLLLALSFLILHGQNLQYLDYESYYYLVEQIKMDQSDLNNCDKKFSLAAKIEDNNA